jgi:L-histidine Nalpha-methyltransferase
MSAAVAPQISDFARDVLTGLSLPHQKQIAPKYFYDELGSHLFEAITYLPEYGLTRADERLLRSHNYEIAELAGFTAQVAELGSGSGRKTRHILSALASKADPVYFPIDISRTALEACAIELSSVANVRSVIGDWMEGLRSVAKLRTKEPLLVLFLGSSVGNLSRSELPLFFSTVRAQLSPGDFFLLGADLVKPLPTMLAAYDDPTGVTAAFNLNLLARMNRELGAHFDLRAFSHEARWNRVHRSIEMHLVSRVKQTIAFEGLDRTFSFEAGESIWTESSHKFTLNELHEFAADSGFLSAASWTDQAWPFAEVLWAAT